MRILHVTTEYPPVIYGGLGTAVGALVEASAQLGLEVAVLLVGGGSTQAMFRDTKLRPGAARRCSTTVAAC